jgi:hypothetical protein
MRRMLCILIASAACGRGSDDQGGPTSGINRSEVLSDLSADERKALCKWGAATLGNPGSEYVIERPGDRFRARDGRANLRSVDRLLGILELSKSPS